MFAVFETGGKQYACRTGTKLTVDSLSCAIGDTITFDKVLLLTDDANHVGAPHVANATIEAKVLEHGKHKKVSIVKFKRRKHHMKSMGHRQAFTKIEVTYIQRAGA